MALPHYTKQELSIYPSNLPKGLINTLIVACLLLGLAALRSSKGNARLAQCHRKLGVYAIVDSACRHPLRITF